MDSTLEDICKIRRLGDGIAARIEATNAIKSKLDAEYAELERENQSLLKDIKRNNHASATLDKEIELLTAHNKSQTEQIALLEEVVRPQLLNELKRSKEEAQSKKLKYDALIDKYETLWQEYEIKYNKFPRVAELKTLEIKAKLMKIEEMKKKQEMLEKRNQVRQLKQIQARRLEILRNEFDRLYAQEQEDRHKYDAVQKELKELRARVALKKAKKQEEQQKLEEERKRKLKEDEVQQQASKTLSAESNSNGTESAQGGNSSLTLLKTFNIPNFTIPQFDDIFVGPSNASPLLKSSKSLSQVLTTSLSVFKGRVQSSASQMMSMCKPAKTVDAVVPNTAPLMSHALDKFPEKGATFLTFQRKGGDTNGPASPLPSSLREENKDPSDVNGQLSLQATPGTNKKEFLLSTDNIVAKIKDAARTNLMLSSGVQIDKTKYPAELPNNVSCGKNELLSSQKSIVNKGVIQSMHCTESMETDQPADDIVISKLGQESNLDRSESTHSSSIDLCSSNTMDENINQNSNQVYDFNTEFNEDDNYNPLRSPPRFDDNVMSPVHAAYALSPEPSIDENEKDTDGDVNVRPSFPDLSFQHSFQPSFPLFGGPSASDNSAKASEKSTLGWSFF